MSSSSPYTLRVLLRQSQRALDSFLTPSTTPGVIRGGRRPRPQWLVIFLPFGVCALYVFVVALYSVGFFVLVGRFIWRFSSRRLHSVGRCLSRVQMRQGLLLLPVFQGDSETFRSLLHFTWSLALRHSYILSYVVFGFPSLLLALYHLLSHVWVSGISSFAIFSPPRQFLLSIRGEGVKK